MAKVAIDVDKLDSKKLHDEWNDLTNAHYYWGYCLNLNFDRTHFMKIDDLCKKLVKFLDNMEFIENDEHYSVGRCKLINYWLYDEVKKILASETRDIYKDTIRELHKSWKDYNAYGSYRAKKYRCNPESNIPSKDDIDDKKKIHEHCLNYYEISKKKDNNDDCQEYKVYIKGLNLPYTKFDSLFPKDEHNYSSYYSKCRTYNPENILKDSICPQEVVIHQPPAKETVTEEQQTLARTNHRAPEPEEEGPASLAAEGGLGVGKVDGELREDQRQGQTGVDQRRVHVEVDVGTEGLTSMGREEQNLVTDLDKESTPLHSQVGEQTVDGLNPTGAPVSNSMVMPASLSLFGIASLSTILYKFTPLRSLFNKLIHKNNSPNSNLHGIREEYIEYMLKSGGKNRDDRANYIAYHPA
ncbi:unnamed protein product [Plasmodium vivax]|uniref:(malaria parasite P. vivax) hypothetical protein n=1 Tax=Plasmodium vivax TaxID=5855 RepID=A0A8S4HJ54_PLAVI|nr:unnamed protein product [Plasmodium vivax]